MMNLAEDIKPITTLKSRTAESIKQVVETGRPMVITQNGEAKAILQDIRTYENMKNAISILKLISRAEDEIKNGETISQEEAFGRLEAKF